MGILAMDDADRVTEWQEKPKQPKSDLASMGVYVFSKRALRRWLSEDRVDFGGNVVPAMLDGGARVFGYRFERLLAGRRARSSRTGRPTWPSSRTAELDLYDQDWVIHTRSEERAPAKVGPTAQVHRSLISHGCVIDGTVVNCVLSPGVRVDVGAVVRDSIVMFDSVIRAGAVVDRAILDKEVVVGPGRDRRRRARRRHAEPAGAGPAQHRDHGRRQAGDHPSRRAPRPQRQGRRRRPDDRLQEPGRQDRRLGRDGGAADRAAQRPRDADRGPVGVGVNGQPRSRRPSAAARGSGRAARGALSRPSADARAAIDACG